MDGISCRRCLRFNLCIRNIQMFHSFFNFPMKFSSSPHGLLRGFVAYEKLEILTWMPQSNFTECGKKCLMKALQNTNKENALDFQIASLFT